ncbi:MAG: PhoH family protein [Candidatus Taylorbacteria bacterium]
MSQVPKKIFVIDTNVVMHDPDSLRAFQEHDVLLPIVVLEELDDLKSDSRKGGSARDAIRALSLIIKNNSIHKGIQLPGGGTLKVDVDGDSLTNLPHGWSPEKKDNIILMTVKRLANVHTDRQVILVTKDSSLRIKANSLELLAEDYLNDNISDLEKMSIGIVDIVVDDQVIADIHQCHQHQHSGSLLLEKMGLEAAIIHSLYSNECCRLRGCNNGKSALAIYNSHDKTFRLVDKPSIKRPEVGVVPRNEEQSFALALAMDPSIGILTFSGDAGTGKSLMALLAGWNHVIKPGSNYRGADVNSHPENDCSRILVLRPTHELGNEIGFLPGTLEEKFAPWQRPTFTSLKLLAGKNHKAEIARLMQEDKIEISCINHMRGDTVNNAFMIIDDAQNFSPKEMKAIITRVGQGTKVIINGDLNQVDVEELGPTSNGFAHAISRFHGQQGCAHLRLLKGERSWIAELAAKIL